VRNGLWNGRGGGASNIQAEDINVWLHNVVVMEEERGGTKGLGNRWWFFVKLIQAI